MATQTSTSASSPTQQMTLIQAITDALRTEMRRNPDVVVLGEDVGINGGVFRATEGLQKEFGAKRVMDTPLTESGIVGAAIGMAVYGLKPVPEIQFSDFIYPAFDQIVSELAKFRYRSGGQFKCPLVIRTPYGGGIRGGLYHSQSPEAYFCHTPGLYVVIPSTPYDAKGLLSAAIRSDDPVIFMEPKKIYRAIKGEVPTGEYTVPLGKARVAKEGSDLSIFCYGAMVDVCQKAAERAQEDGINAEIIDLRTLYPVDEESILESVKKTGRALIVYEAPKTCGYGAEIAALIAEKAVDSLEAPVMRVGGFDTPFPYTLEYIYMPHPARVYRAITELAAYQ
ncbi:MAG: alpha-ketoacid dehydrogenase subunit beta [Vampirovibrionales bacterium]|nr:alpha-ketoacid dehydrogenase subunit beta [Vampirovibrionales bacterium]